MRLTQKTETTIVLIMVCITVIVSVILVLPPDPSTIDTDNDGVMNDKDIFPNNKFESEDSDGDGVGDNSDKFPFDPSASKDFDDDGYPDTWNPGKSGNDSTSDPILTIDIFPYDPSEYIDSDNDGIGDNKDVFPKDPFECSDIDYDGIGDNNDANKNVDLGFTLNLDSFKIKQFIDILPWGQIYFEIRINGRVYDILDNNGRYYRVWINQRQSLNYQITYDVDDATTNDSTKIEIIMYDKDFFNDDIVDINQDRSEHSIILVLDHRTNMVSGNIDEVGQQGVLSYSIDLNSYTPSEIDYYTMTYDWPFKGVSHHINLNISYDKYQWYKNRDIDRSPQFIGTDEMKTFITSDDDIINSLSNILEDKAVVYGYDDVDIINFVLSFIQSNIEYQDDSLSENTSEYWKFPVETLVEENGDCEDSSILFQSIMKNMGYDVIMIFYIIDDETGHLSTGVNINDSFEGYAVTYNNMDYYYCETTSYGYKIGVKPDGIPDDPELIIDLN
jgi:hypothetical protein